MTSAVRVEVNEANLVKNLKFAFSNFSTFLVELIQNSRRAGATRVEISLDGKDLTVVDDGHGIENFQNLFTIAESGWNHQTRSIENPFGMGFTSALFACERLTVESRGQRLEATTRALLDMVEVPVVTGEITTGTRLTLSKLSFDETRMEGALQSIARGYPIPIIFNGVALARPEALDATTFDQTPIGAVWIKDLSHVTLGSSDVCVFLQGILVAGSSHCRAPHVVVHLDSAKFKAKLPDRNCLIDAEEKLARSISTLATLSIGGWPISRRQWLRWILQARTGMSHASMLRTCYAIIRSFPLTFSRRSRRCCVTRTDMTHASMYQRGTRNRCSGKHSIEVNARS